VLVIVAVFASLVGAAFGSFAGVLASRGLRASRVGRSRCDSCRRTLNWYETIPIVSYPVLRGHCRTCHARVGVVIYAWEMGGALLALGVALPVALALRVPVL